LQKQPHSAPTLLRTQPLRLLPLLRDPLLTRLVLLPLRLLPLLPPLPLPLLLLHAAQGPPQAVSRAGRS
jgi:hypothetical protein